MAEVDDEFEGEVPGPTPDDVSSSRSTRYVPTITHRIRRTDADGDAAQFKGRLVRRRGWQP